VVLISIRKPLPNFFEKWKKKLNFLKMEYDLIFFKQMTTTIFVKMEDDPNNLLSLTISIVSNGGQPKEKPETIIKIKTMVVAPL
jgi:hypothetical protein